MRFLVIAAQTVITDTLISPRQKFFEIMALSSNILSDGSLRSNVLGLMLTKMNMASWNYSGSITVPLSNTIR